jgi:predicted molibdopterin-dependent oxidoreductase YjgC
MMRFGEKPPEGVQPISIIVDGEELQALPGDTIASALYAQGKRAWRVSRSGDARGLFCGIGLCFDCLVTVDGKPNQRACVTPVAQGMQVATNLAGERVSR